jgi:ankyrin repeat protein
MATQMITLLLKHGANIDALNKNKESPLMAAACKGRLESILWLIQAGADITLCSYREFTAFVCAAGSRQLGSVKCILDYGIFDNDELRIVLERAIVQAKYAK